MRVNLREYWALTQRIARSFRAQALPLVQQTNLIAPKREDRISPEVAQELKDLVSDYRLKSYRAGVQLLTQEANKLDADPLIMPLAPYRKDWFEGALKLKSQKALLNRLETHVRTAGRRAISQTIPDPMAGATTDNVLYEEAQPYDPEQLEDSDQETRQATGPTGRRLIYPVAYARVLSGPQNCGFCVMLASRGPVYSSASKAGAKGIKGTGSTWTPSSEYPNSFHDSCDCLVVPVYDPEGEWLGKEQAQTLYELWSEVTDNSGITKIDTYEGSRDLKKAFEQHLTDMEERGEHLEVEDLHQDSEDEEALELEGETLEMPQEAAQNQKQTTVEGNSPDPHVFQGLAQDEIRKELEPHELEFEERFKSQGNTALWIPRPKLRNGKGYAPSNDFFWVEKGYQATELKTSKNKYSTIAVRIRDAVRKAKDHEESTVKEHFIIDLGVHSMNHVLKNQLKSYNVRNPEHTIQSLWVMHRNGQIFEEIQLE